MGAPLRTSTLSIPKGWAGRGTLLLLLALSASALALDETSSSDKLRILYSNRLTFTEDGTPLVTVEIMSGQDTIRLSADGGLNVLPDGEGGAEVQGQHDWVVSAVRTAPAVIREWVIVARLAPDDDNGADRAIERWKRLGFAPRTFDVGTVFGTGGTVIDTRQLLIAVASAPVGQGAAKARLLEKRHGVTTSIHSELVERPKGKIVAKSGGTTIENPAVLWFSPTKAGRTTTVFDVVTGHGGSQLSSQKQTRQYFGSVYITVGKDGKLTAVNAVPETRLLAGLVPAEMFPSAHNEALAAQTIAARTELLEKIGRRHLDDPYLLCSNQHCQVYSGAGKEHPRTSRAVKRTRGLVLARKTGGLVDARYSAACGGHSEHKAHIWGGDPDPILKGNVDAAAGSAFQTRFQSGIGDAQLSRFLADEEGGHCAGTRFSKGRYRWTTEISGQQLTALIAKSYPEVGSVLALTPLARGVSGRMNALEIKGARRTVTAQGDLVIRRLLGGLKSSLFAVTKTKGGFRFRGAGFGHGVGMCQLGAMAMADQGSSFGDILRHYYRGSSLQRLY